jgi:YggT family protein
MTQYLLIALRFLVIVLWVLMLGRVLISWVDPRGETALGRFLFQMTEPILAPIRRFMPQTGMIDFSPLVVFLVLAVLLRLVI